MTVPNQSRAPLTPPQNSSGPLSCGGRGITACRSSIVLLAFTAFMLGVTEAIQRVDSALLLGEGGPIELVQLVFLGFSCWTFARTARMEGDGSIHTVFAYGISVAFIRELDGPLDQIWHGFWKVPAAVAGALMLKSVLLKRASLRRSMATFATSPAAGVCLAAAAVVLVQSRLLGRQSSWRGALDSDFVQTVPRLVEETSELAGYALLAWAALEAHRWVKSTPA